MSEPRKILVATDFTPPSEAAVAKAFAIATKLGATVDLLHVFTLQNKTEAEINAEHDTRASERRKLDAVASAHRASGQLGEVLWRDGDPASQVVRAAEETRADIVVLGASIYTWERLRLGSVAETVVREAPSDVLVVRDA